ncbi:MAG: carboxypeptidase-like regulatory domain-containing protein, partial [Niastella sp.]|uniref:carboxypeptidase-like regulatory domain-containing protein n=1 Tax=Niastella sp. TaxID=1869183 RepID=UPI00389A22CF
MKKPILLCSLTAILLLLSAPLFSQTIATLSGTVTDSTKPLGFATVRLLKINNTKPLQTVLTNEQGGFQFSKPDTGNYVLSFTHTGFVEKRISITVNQTSVNMQLEPVQLAKTSGVLKEVVV